MTDHRSTAFGLPPETLARLLGLGEPATPTDPVSRRGRLLTSRLKAPLPLRPDVVERLPELLAQLCRKLAPMDGRTLHELLMDPETPTDVHVEVKDHFKKQAAAASDPDDHAVAIVVYFAAIASALVVQDRRISTQGLDTLGSAFDNLHDKAWVPRWLAELFARASEKVRLDSRDGPS